MVHRVWNGTLAFQLGHGGVRNEIDYIRNFVIGIAGFELDSCFHLLSKIFSCIFQGLEFAKGDRQ